MSWINPLLVYLRRSLLLLLVILPVATAGFAQDSTLAPLELRIMTFNIWLGGELVNFGKVVEAIQAADADVVGLQEAEGNERRLAEALGWHYVSERMQIISRYPLIDPPDGNGIYIFVEPEPGQMIALANVHLPSSPYGPDLVRDGSTLAEILGNEQVTRL
ncbi:MAG: hypothetical protein H7X77_07810, partial [Anaerolineae bacterium]|nr:hypothetical protein [Anaerolineae bacterium]